MSDRELDYRPWYDDGKPGIENCPSCAFLRRVEKSLSFRLTALKIFGLFLEGGDIDDLSLRYARPDL